MFCLTIRPILEYEALVWHPGFTLDLSVTISFPSKTYDGVLVEAGTPTFKARHTDITLFIRSQDPFHYLNQILPHPAFSPTITRNIPKLDRQ